MDDSKKLILAMEKISDLELDKENYKRELELLNEDYEDLSDSYDKLQGVYQDEHCELMQAKNELRIIKSLLSEKKIYLHPETLKEIKGILIELVYSSNETYDVQKVLDTLKLAGV